MGTNGLRLCFYCGARVNPQMQHYLHAYIRHLYRNGSTRYSDPIFHAACFEEFQVHGRPGNPETEYEVLDLEEMKPGG